MANRCEDILRYLEDSVKEAFSSGSDDEWQPDNDNEKIENTEVISKYIASTAERTKSIVTQSSKSNNVIQCV
ncbi:unnamed protein product [Euphydryas editha]|uniref:Uncharacterized protein n=1 Tax=Euphydryas editha TaxID=104508 RepID=A0AAU9TXA9_EUPED|nr:unnamed protein product [Euphydryas editha]